MTNFEIRVTADLLRPAVVGVRGQGIALQKGDSRAHSIVCDVVRGGDPVELDGFTAAVYAQYGSTKYKLTDTTVSGHTVMSVIDPGIYSNLSGVVTFAVKLTNAAQGIDMTAAIILAVIEQTISDGTPQVPTSEAWTEAVIVRYLDQLKYNVDTFDELKADIEKDVQDFLGNVVYDADQAVTDWLNEHFADATWRITEEDKREIANMISFDADGDVVGHINNATIHVTESDKANWNGKQNNIADLSQIRNNGYKAVNALGEYDAWSNNKSYDVGSYCIYDNTLWRCILANSGRTPSDGSYWQKVSLKSIKEDIVNDRGTDEQWSASKSYAVGNYVIYNNALWRCILAHSGQTPAEGTYWTQVSLKSLNEEMLKAVIMREYHASASVPAQGRKMLQIPITTPDGYIISGATCFNESADVIQMNMYALNPSYIRVGLQNIHTVALERTIYVRVIFSRS